jgi:hypothetical protein
LSHYNAYFEVCDIGVAADEEHARVRVDVRETEDVLSDLFEIGQGVFLAQFCQLQSVGSSMTSTIVSLAALMNVDNTGYRCRRLNSGEILKTPSPAIQFVTNSGGG